jgi:hypothetical protein
MPRVTECRARRARVEEPVPGKPSEPGAHDGSPLSPAHSTGEADWPHVHAAHNEESQHTTAEGGGQ